MNRVIKSLSYNLGNCLAALWRRTGVFVPDKAFLEVLYYLSMGKKLDLNNPRTFGDKIQWLKLYDRRPEYTRLVDKYEVKEYVAGIVGREYVIPLLGVWDSVDDIDWNSLPNSFVMKTTHGGGSGGVIICKDKSKLDKQKTQLQLKHSLKQNIYSSYREWPYKDVQRRIIAEQFIIATTDLEELSDYKWYCFNGEPMFCQVIQDRHKKETIDYFDKDWNHQPFIGLNPKAENALVQPIKPANLDIHLEIARKLSSGIPFSRIDLYDTGDHVYFGEVTFYPASGIGYFRPDQYNVILGQLINLPVNNI
jgi:hypothetical protein